MAGSTAIETTEDPIAVEWLDVFLPTVVQIAIFGGSITFTVVISNNKTPSAYKFREGTVTTFLALAWLFFVLALALASIAQMALSANRALIVRGFLDAKHDDVKLDLNKEAHGTNDKGEKNWRRLCSEILTLVWWGAKMRIFVVW